MMPERERRVGAAGEDGVGLTGADRLRGETDRVRATTRMRRRPRTRRPSRSSFVDTADDAALYIDVGMPSGMDAAVLRVEAAVVRVERLAAAEARADEDSDALGCERRGRPPAPPLPPRR